MKKPLLRIAIVLCTLVVVGCARPVAVEEARPLALLPKERKLLAEWWPKSPQQDTHPVLELMVRHGLSKKEIRSYINPSVAIEDHEGSWYIPVVPSQGFMLVFDSNDHLARVQRVGGEVLYQRYPEWLWKPQQVAE